MSDNHDIERTCPTDGTCNSVAVSIVSHSSLMREGLFTLLSRHLDLILVGSYPVERSCTSSFPNPPGHVVILDGNIDHMETIAWTRYWRCQESPAHVVITELEHKAETVLACIEAGASGYTLRGTSALELAHMITAVRRGHTYCSPDITAQIFQRLSELREQLPQQHELRIPITSREREVLNLLVADYSNQEIAAALVIEIHTVKHHVHNILEKLKVKHRWEAARLAREYGWITNEQVSSAQYVVQEKPFTSISGPYQHEPEISPSSRANSSESIQE